MVCADDKAVILVGEPDHVGSSGVRAHNRSLEANNNTVLGALDHNWKLLGIIALLTLLMKSLRRVMNNFSRARQL